MFGGHGDGLCPDRQILDDLDVPEDCIVLGLFALCLSCVLVPLSFRSTRSGRLGLVVRSLGSHGGSEIEYIFSEGLRGVVLFVQ